MMTLLYQLGEARYGITDVARPGKARRGMGEARHY
jgi:hypothetical protein